MKWKSLGNVESHNFWRGGRSCESQCWSHLTNKIFLMQSVHNRKSRAPTLLSFHISVEYEAAHIVICFIPHWLLLPYRSPLLSSGGTGRSRVIVDPSCPTSHLSALHPLREPSECGDLRQGLSHVHLLDRRASTLYQWYREEEKKVAYTITVTAGVRIPKTQDRYCRCVLLFQKFDVKFGVREKNTLFSHLSQFS